MKQMNNQIKLAAKMATEWWAERLLSGDKIKFSETLQPLIENDLISRGSCFLECDYDPQKHLLTAVRAAGLECGGFLFSAKGILPTKHTLAVVPSRLTPKEGYGNWTAEIEVRE